MSAANLIKYGFLAYFSQPAAERRLYRLVRRHGCRSIIEIGLPSLRRSTRLIEVAQRFAGSQSVRFTGIDLFEEQTSDRPAISLKSTFRRLRTTGARIRLLPGTPTQALSQFANRMPAVDLILISAEFDAKALAGAWFYLPRLLHDGSHVLREEHDAEQKRSRWQPISRVELERLAARPSWRRKAA